LRTLRRSIDTLGRAPIGLAHFKIRGSWFHGGAKSQISSKVLKFLNAFSVKAMASINIIGLRPSISVRFCSLHSKIVSSCTGICRVRSNLFRANSLFTLSRISGSPSRFFTRKISISYQESLVQPRPFGCRINPRVYSHHNIIVVHFPADRTTLPFHQTC